MGKQTKRGTPPTRPATPEAVSRSEGHSLRGDKILVTCRKPGKWSTATTPTGQHNRYETVASKDAEAILLTAYTNVRR